MLDLVYAATVTISILSLSILIRSILPYFYEFRTSGTVTKILVFS